MRPIQQRIQGQIFQKGAQVALLLAEAGPDLFLRFAYLRRGSEQPFWPALLLDDWGSEIRKLALYRWVAEFGDQFPRAELFGFDQNGMEAQCFLRDLEFHLALPLHVVAERQAPVTAGMQLTELVRPGEAGLRAAARPAALKPPLSQAAVRWWQGDEAGLRVAGYRPV